MRKTATLIFVLVLAAATTGAQEKSPVAISPGCDEGMARIGEKCPTFSWTAVEWAVGYKVVVFETSGPNIPEYKEMATISSPILSKEIQGRALSWTPSSDEWPSNGGFYIWYVQALDDYGTAKWSQGRVFEVKIIDRFARIGKTLSRTLREYGVSEEVIGEVLRKTAFELEEAEIGETVSKTTVEKTILPIGVQGNEIGTNTYYGEYAGDSLTAYATDNSFFGDTAGTGVADGDSNTYIGHDAGKNNANGEENTVVGSEASALGTSGNHNTFIGFEAGKWNTTSDNTFIGYKAGAVNSTGIQNTYIGFQAGKDNNAGINNTFVGYQAGMSSDSSHNTFLGRSTGESNTTGNSNTFLGHSAGYLNTTGQSGTYVGRAAGYNNEEGDNNTFVGYFSGYNNEGGYNTFIGRSAGYTNSTGEGNTFLGCNAGYNETGSYKLYIDNSSTNSPLIWGDFTSDILTVHGKLGVGTKSPAYQMEVETTGENAILLIDRTDGATTGFSASGDKCAFGTLSNHPLWMVINGAFSAIFHTDGSLQMMNGAWCTAAGKWQDASSRELKENIQSLTVEEAEDALEGLEPVRFNYKADADDESLGFIAEDVPELVASKDRKSMSAMDVVAVLTKMVQEHQETIGILRKEIDELKKKNK